MEKLQGLGEQEAADLVERSTIEILKEGKTVTYDLGGTAKTGEVGDAIARKVTELG